MQTGMEGGAWGEESTGPLNLPLLRRGKGHQAKGGGIVQGIAQAAMGVQHPARKG